MALFHPLEETFVVAGTREEWVKKCEEALRVTPHFQDVVSSAELFRVSARYRRDERGPAARRSPARPSLRAG